MHIAESFLPPAHALVWSAVVVPVFVASCRDLKSIMKHRSEATYVLAAAGRTLRQGRTQEVFSDYSVVASTQLKMPVVLRLGLMFKELGYFEIWPQDCAGLMNTFSLAIEGGAYPGRPVANCMSKATGGSL